MYRQYSFNIIPHLGQLLAGDRESYQYLIESIERFPTQPEFARMVADAGFLLPSTPESETMGLPRLGSACSPSDGAWEGRSQGLASIWVGASLLTWHQAFRVTRLRNLVAPDIGLSRVVRKNAKESKCLFVSVDVPAWC